MKWDIYSSDVNKRKQQKKIGGEFAEEKINSQR
jgi:hypothetical protein